MERKLYFPKDREGVEHFPGGGGGPTFSRGGGSKFFQGGGVPMLSAITITCEFFH